MGFLFGSLLLETLIVLLSTMVILFFWLQKRYKYFEERGVPYAKPVFLLGNTHRMLLGRERIGVTMFKLYKESRGQKMLGAFQLFRPMYLVRDPDLVTKLMVNQFSDFNSHGVMEVDEDLNPLEAHLFNLDGEKWHVLRKKLSPTFTSGKLKWMYPQMGVCGETLMKSLEQEIQGHSKDLEVRDFLTRFTTDVIASCAFGLEPVSIKDKDSHFRTIGKKVVTPDLKQFLLLGFRQAFPNLVRVFKIKTVPEEIDGFFKTIVKKSFEERKRTGLSRNDFVQLLLQLREKGSVDLDPKDFAEDDDDALPDEDHQIKLEMTDQVLTAQAFVFFVAGFETTATTMTFLLYELSKKPDVQERIREEVRRVKEKHGGEISYDALKDMAYLEACISETLRLHPPLELHFRKCTKDTVFEGVRIDKDTPVIVSVLGLHTDPEYWSEPTEFRPERFLGSDAIRPGTYVPFGFGPRICIGRRFALVEVKLCMSIILQEYKVSPSLRQSDDIKCNPWSIIPQPLDGLWVHFNKLETSG